jgi:imidazolonepropionase-like amidohydrolase
MTRALLVAPLLFLGSAQPTTTVFEGARLILGDGRSPIERGTLMVQHGRIVAVGEAVKVSAPSAAVRVDLSGKTVIPALVNLHGHVGFQRGATYAAENYTRDNILDNLDRYAYHGVGTIVSMGTDAGELPYEIRRDQAAGRVGGAFLRHAGRGFALPNAGPGAAALRGAPYGVTTDDDARRAVRELAAKRVDVVKIWVDDRNGTVPKLPPEIYRAIIDEAHRHKLRVVAHVYYLADAKALARAGIDGFAHPVRDALADQELIDLLKGRDIFVMANLGLAERGSRNTDRAAAIYRNMEQSIGTLARAGVRVLLGSDSGVQNHLAGEAEHRELELMVRAGMTPADAIAGATGRAAAALGLNDVGVLDAGRIADFVVLEANPLENISSTRQIAQMYLRGVALDRAALAARWNAAR